LKIRCALQHAPRNDTKFYEFCERRMRRCRLKEATISLSTQRQTEISLLRFGIHTFSFPFLPFSAHFFFSTASSFAAAAALPQTAFPQNKKHPEIKNEGAASRWE
jgi:hypothetical protein